MSESSSLKSTYEFHDHSDPDFPIIFHPNHIIKSNAITVPHWHKAIELLYVTEGHISVIIDGVPVDAKTGDLVVVNSSSLHTFKSHSSESDYLCLIIDMKLCKSFGLSVSDPLQAKFTFPEIGKYFNKIDKELTERVKNYKAIVKAEALSLIAFLYRHNTLPAIEEAPHNPAQLVIVREATAYISENFYQTISTTDVCNHVGLSKYYFCRIFKTITSFTVTEYINKLRCDHARKLIATGDYNISESAELSGFQNLSYFSKTYRRYVGNLPSESRKFSDGFVTL